MGDERQRSLANLLEFRKGDAYDVEIVDYHKG